LAATDAEPLRKTLATLRVPVFVVRSVVEEMRYDTAHRGPAGQAIRTDLRESRRDAA
jgi:hypothetical protein